MSLRSTRLAVTNYYAAHPWTDMVTVTALAIWWAWDGAERLTPEDANTRLAFYSGVATLAALVLAAATFVCTMVYQSASPHVEAVRKEYGTILRSNWIVVIAWSLIAAAAPVVSILLDAEQRGSAMTTSVVALGLVVVRFARSVYWLRMTLFLQHVSDAADPPYLVKFPERKAG